ncbi:hypothetical protein ISN45_Aa06g015740 [Arabidopsis thaliana x Arabidopsis arenosa]|uniref:Uncharacterized protein n=1 Tax=Arabidopsis thaliana x Arabidopsis arenosa TaxID=1240361 RepID=A0A8T1YWE2_9BRAS|nr:hypothetical protein ISN45_Aa06g015740 [Arabidopsis thaliana x Arabidopsis arenosa]
MNADGEGMATTRTSEEIDREAEENRKEALLASTLSLQPNFNRSNVSQKQISKLQELHKRRMQIKANTKIHKKKPKATKTSQSKAIKDGESSNKLKESTSSSSTLDEQNKTLVTVPKKPQKLFWGLDTRERWERKANM